MIIITHEPSWLLDWYWSSDTGQNVRHLICDVLNYRCKLRMAGDLHHYMRHSCTQSDAPVHVQHLLVNGCGGAFLHPTHVFSKFSKYYGASYASKAAYPSFHDSSKVKLLFLQFLLLCALMLNGSGFCCLQIALGNILKFRKKNWQFDFIGGIIYFILVFSLFPQVRFKLGLPI